MFGPLPLRPSAEDLPAAAVCRIPAAFSLTNIFSECMFAKEKRDFPDYCAGAIPMKIFQTVCEVRPLWLLSWMPSIGWPFF